MALNVTDICLKALARISPLSQENATLFPLLRSSLPAALNSLGSKVALGNRRQLLEKSFTFSINAPTQTADLTAAFETGETLLIPYDPTTGNFVQFEQVFTTLGTAYFIPSKQLLDIAELDNGQIYYGLRAQTMFLKSAESQSGNVTVYGSYIPIIEDDLVTITIPAEFEDDLVNELIATYKMAQPLGVM